MDRRFLTQKRGVSIPPSSRETDVYKRRHHGTSKASNILPCREDRDKEILLYCILDLQNFIHMMYYILRKLKKHAKSAAKQIPERDVYPLANKYCVIQLFQVSSSLG